MYYYISYFHDIHFTSHLYAYYNRYLLCTITLMDILRATTTYYYIHYYLYHYDGH